MVEKVDREIQSENFRKKSKKDEFLRLFRRFCVRVPPDFDVFPPASFGKYGENAGFWKFPVGAKNGVLWKLGKIAWISLGLRKVIFSDFKI